MKLTKQALFEAIGGEATPHAPIAGPHSLAPYLKKSAQTLWAKCDPKTHTKEERRLAFVSALSWLGEKNGWEPHPNVPQVYVTAGQKTKGKGALLWKSLTESVLFEITYEPKKATLDKLWAGHLDRRHAVLFICSTADEPVIKEKLDRLAKNWSKWLTAIVLR
jgi:hypothetical protein